MIFNSRRTPPASEGNVRMGPSDDGSVTFWIEGLKAGDGAAAEQLWQRYFESLVGLARSALRGSPRRAEDEEDAALSAFDSFCAAAAQGRFPRLDDRAGLWRILVTITRRKALDQVERQERQKRGGGAEPETGSSRIEQIATAEPTPEFAALVADECRRLLASLADERQRQIAILRMEGYTSEEIAQHLGCGLRSVVRKLDLIRKTWLAEGPCAEGV
jgi:RNA polymerase sigma factor (sigma-70 family)